MTPDPSPIDTVRTAARAAARAQKHADATRSDRDHAIRAALAEGSSQALIGQITGLSRTAVSKISRQGVEDQ